MPSGSEKYVASQIQELIGRNWSEVSSTLRIPKDFHLFQIQSMEILKTMTRVFEETQLLRRVLGELTASVYEIPSHISLE